ncbi:MAG: tyrosinase family protein [Lunatimonas sp.]|uniref:tyrosinase family protein n=1 Tax=Lunatimonas sp. TaxID=2060141 RepID=UPI00263A9997|nr:tyrosinase family protein [Lunatimonas sp.]MCC5936057.1 tyrosinase family protein [Lunatimonas sp.]
MAPFTRKNAWNNQGTFANPDLLWYAKGVGAMQAKALSDENSWWFFAAMHGEYLAESKFPGWGQIPGLPRVPSNPVPSPAIQDEFWNQCQHQSWFFAPWHRGYLIALEAQIRTEIVGMGGPSDWALPYWNYFGPNDQYKIPPAFTQQSLPDGTTNPLYVTARYGPKGNGTVYIEIPPISKACQSNTVYTGTNAETPSPGYGGPSTGFSHGGNVSGNLESNPHNLIHVQVGGQVSDTLWGLMSDPGIAALDPIFYLHHCNIDRMWAAWNAAGNKNPTDTNWLGGPASTGDRPFVMPMPNGTTWNYSPADVNSLSSLDYEYDDLFSGISTVTVNALTKRMNILGVQPTDASTDTTMELITNSELVGANDKTLTLDGAGLQTTIRFDSGAWKKVSKSFLNASETTMPDQIYLQIENVKGNVDANILTVSVNHQLAGHISLFGLRKASKQDGHDGSGLSFILPITPIIDSLHLENSLNLEALDVKILPSNPIGEKQKITVGRISVYREQQLLQRPL